MTQAESNQTAASPSTGNRKAGASARTIVLLAVGLGCLCGFARMYALGFAGYLSYEVASSVDQMNVMRAVVELVAFSLLALNGWFGWVKPRFMWLAAASVLAIGSAMLFANDPSGTWEPVVVVAGGLAIAVLAYVWTLLLSVYEVRTIVLATLPAFVLASVIIAGAPLTGPEVGLVIATLSAFAAGACAMRLDPDLTSAAPDGAIGASEMMRIPWLTVILVVACGFLATVLLSIAQSLTWLYDWQVNYVVVVVASAIAVGLTAWIMLKSRGWMHIAWVPLFALFALAIVLSCLPMRAVIQLAVGCIMAALFSALFLYWMVFPGLISALKIPHAFLAGMVLLLMQSAFPTIVGDALASTLPRSMQSLGGVSGLMAVLLAVLFAFTFVANRSRLGAVGMWTGDSHSKGDESQDAGSELDVQDAESEAVEDAANPTDVLKERLDGYVQQFGLTPRESEVALYTVQGFSCAYIAEKLVVSNSTVRFHQQNIYRKFDVHSRNELIEFVASESPREGEAS